MRNMTLGTKLTVGGIAFVVIPLIVVGWLAYSRANTGLNNLANSRVEYIARDMADAIQIALNEEMKLALAMSKDPTLIATVEKVGKEGLDKSQAEISALDAKLKGVYDTIGKDYESISVTDANGIVISDGVGGKHKGINTGDRGYFKKAKEGQANIGDAVKSRATGNPVAVIAAPLNGSDGKFYGTLSLIMKIDFLVEKITTEAPLLRLQLPRLHLFFP